MWLRVPQLDVVPKIEMRDTTALTATTVPCTTHLTGFCIITVKFVILGAENPEFSQMCKNSNINIKEYCRL
jgi:hypothetical protein